MDIYKDMIYKLSVDSDWEKFTTYVNTYKETHKEKSAELTAPDFLWILYETLRLYSNSYYSHRGNQMKEIMKITISLLEAKEPTKNTSRTRTL